MYFNCQNLNLDLDEWILWNRFTYLIQIEWRIVAVSRARYPMYIGDRVLPLNKWTIYFINNNVIVIFQWLIGGKWLTTAFRLCVKVFQWQFVANAI